MKYILIVICIILFLFHFGIWLASEVNENDNLFYCFEYLLSVFNFNLYF